MDSRSAITTFAALAHDTRIAIFRLLVKAGPDGVAAGEIARHLNIRPNSLTANLNILSHAGLITSRREGRSIIYSAGYEAMREVFAFLVEDCCAGVPEICGSLASVLAAAQCRQSDPP